ncbi:hypothetical protein GLAREA_03185 [Glarea lozoyensis ATCC 20868]|uniref:2EXR domain-containing protein n=1 Tax=Glarea lozoyensis (strain ATCC 20868 / MF5171) TaxID=1116229 RepID=S3CNJ6_GLAL2|nr:uncharacterized protein GLAREA_03185 [Glarea lozoyensis ATCC 20868]EPE27270.1 hypothetical protein GLAREA_03185 [Glarea lozoyensis ATCC 20868]
MKIFIPAKLVLMGQSSSSGFPINNLPTETQDYIYGLALTPRNVIIRDVYVPSTSWRGYRVDNTYTHPPTSQVNQVARANAERLYERILEGTNGEPPDYESYIWFNDEMDTLGVHPYVMTLRSRHGQITPRSRDPWAPAMSLKKLKDLLNHEGNFLDSVQKIAIGQFYWNFETGNTARGLAGDHSREAFEAAVQYGFRNLRELKLAYQRNASPYSSNDENTITRQIQDMFLTEQRHTECLVPRIIFMEHNSPGAPNFYMT